MYTAETFRKIPIAIVDNNAYRTDMVLKNVLQSVADGDDALFQVTVATQEESSQLLDTGAVVGVVNAQGGLHAEVRSAGMGQTILKSFLDSYLQMTQTATTLMTQNPTAIFTGLMEDLSEHRTYIKPLSGMPAPETLLAFFYALLAMACMYGSFWGAQEVMDIQANLSAQGARVCAAPIHKLKVFLAGLGAAMAIQYCEMLIVIAFMRYVLNVNFGNQTGYVLLLSFIGSFMGVTFGAAVAAIGRKSEGVITGILISVSMVLSFFSGLMMVDIKYLVAKAFPLSSFINPATLVADGFYALYYYEDHGRYWLNIGILLAFSLLFCLLIYRAIRRRKYASL